MVQLVDRNTERFAESALVDRIADRNVDQFAESTKVADRNENDLQIDLQNE